jgi:hypothetical protein
MIVDNFTSPDILCVSGCCCFKKIHQRVFLTSGNNVEMTCMCLIKVLKMIENETEMGEWRNI